MKVFHGVHGPVSPEGGIAELCRLYAQRMPPHHVFSHTTAALLYGVPLPRRSAKPLPLHVTAAAPARAPLLRNVVGHQTRLNDGTVREVDGLPVVSPGRMLVELAAMLRLPDLVAAGDFLVTGDPPAGRLALTSHEELEGVAKQLRHVAGKRMLQEALPLIRVGAFSRPETLVRLAALDAGLPEPSLNRPIREGRTYLGRPDLSWPSLRVGIEYEGDYHRTREVFQTDIARLERFADFDWHLFRATANDLPTLDAFMRRVRRRMLARGWRSDH